MALASPHSATVITDRVSWQTDEAAQWLENYGQHLGRLYAPSASLPPDLDELVSAIAVEADRPDDWPEIF